MKGLIITENDIKIAEGAELIHASLKNLLFFEINSLINNLNRGSRIFDFFYEPIEQGTAGILQEIITLVTNFMPMITVDSVAVNVEHNEGILGIVIFIQWYFNEEQENMQETIIQQNYSLS